MFGAFFDKFVGEDILKYMSTFLMKIVLITKSCIMFKCRFIYWKQSGAMQKNVRRNCQTMQWYKLPESAYDGDLRFFDSENGRRNVPSVKKNKKKQLQEVAKELEKLVKPNDFVVRVTRNRSYFKTA